MGKIALTLILFLISSSAFAEFGRSTSFDDREICEKEKGVWREFGNSAADSCDAKLDKYAVAAQALTYACDCGKGRCWGGEKCFLMQDYKMVYEQRQVDEKQRLEEAKRARQGDYKDNSNQRLQVLIDKSKAAGGDPKASPNNNMAQFYDKALSSADAATNDATNQIQSAVDQGALAAKQFEGQLGKVFSLPPSNPAPVATPAPAPDVATLPAAPATTIIQNSESSLTAGPTPFFLQQQAKAKQEAAAVFGSNNKSGKAATQAQAVTPPGLPELPQILLPQ